MRNETVSAFSFYDVFRISKEAVGKRLDYTKSTDGILYCEFRVSVRIVYNIEWAFEWGSFIMYSNWLNVENEILVLY